MNITVCFSVFLLSTTVVFIREPDTNDTLPLNISSLPRLRDQAPFFQFAGMKFFFIPPLICLLVAAAVIPFILFAIFSSSRARQEPRYLILGSTMLYNLLYLFFYTLLTILNVSNLQLPKNACVLLLFLISQSYCGSLLTAVAMVLDTYIAILWPLRYASIVTLLRTKKLILSIWVFAGLLPAILFLILWATQEPTLCPVEMCSLPVILVMALLGDNAVKLCYVLSLISLFLCFFLITFCYFSLYVKTRQLGIWKGITSRASITFLMHHTVLFLNFCPLLAHVVETLLYSNHRISLETGLWLSLMICNILVVLPKALSPYLYGLRYREITKTLRLLCGRKHPNLRPPAMLS
ncbi:putative G-protein coupled receptor 148 [Phascolarctos cinereus]|uniref:Probable G-protein coupled receptor 148 n=1 Tax=Phascolarctos cinereus TaxID=38626 RepID=A0A6P5ILK3_PHACI|nr:probable G-protein coupled receptor 148 [Phascolarctos cinereus]